MSEMPDLDLFGHPMKPLRDPRGRPSFAKSPENQLVVISLKGAGWKQGEIAAYLRCDDKTLRKYFSRELEHGALILDGMAMQVIVRKMMAGSLAAARQVREITQARIPTKPAAKPAAPLGKKELAARDAHDMPDAWADLLGDEPVN